MAKISREDLEHYSNADIKEIMVAEHWSELPEPVYSYIQAGFLKDGYVGSRLNRVEKLLSLIIVDRFVDGKIN